MLGISYRRRSCHVIWLGVSRTVIAIGVVAACFDAAHAQGAVELPGIVVQGATLERPAPVRRSQPMAPGEAVPSADQGTDEQASDPAVGGIPVAKIGSAVTVVTGAQLRAQQVRTVADALRSLPGVSVNRVGGPAGLTQVRIRGAEANHTLVLIDGVVANSGTDGEFDFSDLLPEDLERIEVIRGPHSALYGSNAVGGVINIVTRDGRGPLTVTARTEVGSFGTRDTALRVSGGTDRAWAAATMHYLRTNGFNIAPDAILDETDGSRLASFSAKAGFRPVEGITVNVNLRNTSKWLERDDQTGITPGSNRGGFVVATDSLSRQDGNVLLMGGNIRWDMLDRSLTHIFTATRNLTERNDLSVADFGFGISPSHFNNTSEVRKLGYQGTYRFATPLIMAVRHSVTGLVEQETELFTPGPDRGDSITKERGRTSFAGEWRGEFFNRLFVSAGLRHDDNDSLPNYTTWRSTVSLLMGLGLRPHASIGTAVKLPSQFEQFGTGAQFVRNPELTAEESFGWDAGLEFTFLAGKAVIDVTYFKADLQNKIAAQFASVFDPASPFACNPGDLFCSRSINVPGTSRREGVEAGLRAELINGLTLGLAYTYTEAFDGQGEREKRRPPHAARADLTYRFDDGRGVFNLAAIYNGEMTDTVFGWPQFASVATTTLDAYWLVSAAAAYKIRPDLEVFGRVENLLDQKYEETFGFNTAGVAVFAGVRFTYQDRALP